MERELGPKGFAVLEGAINTDANIPLFIQQFHPAFPVGMASQMGALQYMQLSPVVLNFVPYIAFIDRKGIIREQLTGKDLSDETQARIFRDIAVKLLNEPATPAKPKAKSASR
jgi:hypothetical protein